jgi:asparagine N-glycosylation enzyme membrane subunit Stt3
MNKKFIFLFVAIMLVAVLLRSLTGYFGTFMEPDNYYYLSIIQQAISNHLTITSALSGFPQHPAYPEQPGLIFLPIVLTYITRSITEAMLYLPVLFGLLETIMVYLLTYEISKSRKAGLFAMLIFAMMPAAIWKNTMGEFRGETFVPLFAAILVYALIKFVKSRNPEGFISGFGAISLGWASLACAALAASLWMWNGGLYVATVPLFFALFYVISKVPRLSPAKSYLLALLILCVLAAIGMEIYGMGQSNIATETAAPTWGSFFLAYGLAMILAVVGMAQLLKEGKMPEAYALSAILIVTAALAIETLRFNILPTLPIAVLAGMMLAIVYESFKSEEKPESVLGPIGASAKKTGIRNQETRMKWYVVGMLFFAQFATMLLQVPYFAPADGITSPQFTQALNWIRNNTASNITFLSLWPDGSLIEGVAQRQSYTDSVAGQNGSRIKAFAKFLTQPSGNLTYLCQVKPDYLLVRSLWMSETQSINQEAGRPENETFNDTNMNSLVQGTLGGVKIVYHNNDTIVYSVVGCH